MKTKNIKKEKVALHEKGLYILSLCLIFYFQMLEYIIPVICTTMLRYEVTMNILESTVNN